VYAVAGVTIAIIKMPDVDISTSRGVFFALAALYAPLLVWSAWKLVQLGTVAPEWTIQKSIHLLIAFAAAGG